MCVSECMCVYEPLEVKRGHQIIRNWSLGVCERAVMGMLETELGPSERRASDHSHQAISHFWNILTGKMGYLSFIAERFDLVFET